MLARILEDSGGDRRAVVYVPGVDGTGEFLFGTARTLAERFRLVRVHYAASAAESCDGSGYGTLAASLAEQLARLELERPLLLAESFGVGVALRLALDHPGRVGGLALVNGFARYDQRIRIRLAASLGALLPAWLFDLGRRLTVSRVLFGAQRTPEVTRAFLALPGGRFDWGYRCRLRMIADLDLLDELPRLRLPVRIYASERDRVVRSVRSAREMEERIAGAQTVVLEGAGHATLPFRGEFWRGQLAALEEQVRVC